MTLRVWQNARSQAEHALCDQCIKRLSKEVRGLIVAVWVTVLMASPRMQHVEVTWNMCKRGFVEARFDVLHPNPRALGRVSLPCHFSQLQLPPPLPRGLDTS
jgi:hypothetical protein